MFCPSISFEIGLLLEQRRLDRLCVQQSDPQGTISAVLNKITNQDDLNPPSVENARIVFKKTGKTLQISINSVVDDSKIAGYYVYFGPDMIANPLAAGTFTKKVYAKTEDACREKGDDVLCVFRCTRCEWKHKPNIWGELHGAKINPPPFNNPRESMWLKQALLLYS